MKKALIISCFDWYKNRIEPIREVLINKGYEVTVLVADFDHIKKKTIATKYQECTYVRVPRYNKNLSLCRIYSHLFFGKIASKWLYSIMPDLVYLQIPPNNTAKYCKKYKHNHPNSKLVLDLIDLWPESMPIDKVGNTFPARIWRSWRDTCIDEADHIFTECKLYQEKLKLNTDKTSTLHLIKEQSEKERELVESIIDNRKPEKNKIKFAYLGSMNNIIDIEGICTVIKDYIKNGYECELHAVGDGEARKAFENAVKQAGCRTHFYGPVFDEIEKIKILAPCDYAFNMMKGNITVGLTIKSIDYLSYGLPLINSIKGDTWEMVQDYKIGYNVGSSEMLYNNNDHYVQLKFFRDHFTKNALVKAFESSMSAF